MSRGDRLFPGAAQKQVNATRLVTGSVEQPRSRESLVPGSEEELRSRETYVPSKGSVSTCVAKKDSVSTCVAKKGSVSTFVTKKGSVSTCVAKKDSLSTCVAEKGSASTCVEKEGCISTCVAKEGCISTCVAEKVSVTTCVAEKVSVTTCVAKKGSESPCMPSESTNLNRLPVGEYSMSSGDYSCMPLGDYSCMSAGDYSSTSLGVYSSVSSDGYSCMSSDSNAQALGLESAETFLNIDSCLNQEPERQESISGTISPTAQSTPLPTSTVSGGNNTIIVSGNLPSCPPPTSCSPCSASPVIVSTSPNPDEPGSSKGKIQVGVKYRNSYKRHSRPSKNIFKRRLEAVAKLEKEKEGLKNQIRCLEILIAHYKKRINAEIKLRNSN